LYKRWWIGILDGEVEVTVQLWSFKMRSKLLLSVAAPALAALAFFTTAEPASAQWWGYRGLGWGPAAVAAGIIGGAIAAATPGYYYGYGYPYGYSYGYGPSYSSYGYGYSTAYGYGPSYTYGYNYSPGYYWGNAYASAERGTIAVRRNRHVRAR
jgi:hypothetical protein